MILVIDTITTDTSNIIANLIIHDMTHNNQDCVKAIMKGLHVKRYIVKKENYRTPRTIIRNYFDAKLDLSIYLLF